MTAPLPLPATPEAYAMGCTCLPHVYVNPCLYAAVVDPDCPLHSESARAQPARLSGTAT